MANRKDKGKARAKPGPKPRNPNLPVIPKPKPDRKYICQLCGNGFTRRESVREPHFAACVKAHGNPYNTAWDAHPSCWLKRSKGPSGKQVPGAHINVFKLEENEDVEMGGHGEGSARFYSNYVGGRRGDEDEEMTDVDVSDQDY